MADDNDDPLDAAGVVAALQPPPPVEHVSHESSEAPSSSSSSSSAVSTTSKSGGARIPGYGQTARPDKPQPSGGDDTDDEDDGSQFRQIEHGRQTIPIDGLTSWQDSYDEASVAASSSSSDGGAASRFPVRVDLNKRLYLWRGDILKLEVHVVVNSTNEPLNDTSGLCGRILNAAGPELRRELERLEGCRTGESKLTNGYNLNARAIAHTVGPRYNLKYKTAAENALHSCYRSTLQLVKEAGYGSVAFCVVNSAKRGYPPAEGAHIAIRTVRRFLEHHADGLDAVVFVMSKQSDLDIYTDTLPLYFPRSASEEQAAALLLPEYTGNEHGETVVAERQIRIDRFPGAGGAGSDEDDDNDDADDSNTKSGKRYHDDDDNIDASGFTKMSGDIDVELQRRVLAQAKAQSKESLYQQYLQRARQSDLSSIASRNVIYQSGTTSLGKPIVIMVGSHLPNASDAEEMSRLFLYVIRTMDAIVESNYIAIYLHAGLQDRQRPTLDWLRNIYNVWDQKYSTNLDSLFVLHPTLGLKFFWGLLSPFVSSSFKAKVRYIDSLARLYDIVDHAQLRLPEIVYREDERLHGTPSGHAAISHETL